MAPPGRSYRSALRGNSPACWRCPPRRVMSVCGSRARCTRIAASVSKAITTWCPIGMSASRSPCVCSTRPYASIMTIFAPALYGPGGERPGGRRCRRHLCSRACRPGVERSQICPAAARQGVGDPQSDGLPSPGGSDHASPHRLRQNRRRDPLCLINFLSNAYTPICPAYASLTCEIAWRIRCACAEREGYSYLQFLDTLFEEEAAGKEQRPLDTALRTSGLPVCEKSR